MFSLPARAYAPVVQRIEQIRPKDEIEVRFLSGAHALAGGDSYWGHFFFSQKTSSLCGKDAKEILFIPSIRHHYVAPYRKNERAGPRYL